MAEPVQERISAFWTTVADHYETHPGNTVPVGSEMHERWTQLLRSALPPAPADVLDVGTGTGFAALILAALGHRVTAVDLARGMLNVAEKMADERGLDVAFVESDAVAPALPESSFDAIVCRHLLWTLRDAHVAIGNWRRLLRRGGRVVAVDGFRTRQAPDPEPAEDDFFGRHYTAAVQASIPFMHVQDKGPLIDAFVNAGYGRVDIDDLAPEFADEDDVRPYLLVARLS